jgi:hypothetical protein
MGGTRSSSLSIAAVASSAAAVLHATAAGTHADHVELSRIFVVLAVAQIAVAVAGFVSGTRLVAASIVAVDLLAVVGWIVTWSSGVSFVAGLETAEGPHLADTVAALLAMIAVADAGSHLVGRTTVASAGRLTVVGVAVGSLLVPGLVDATGHDHTDHADDHADDHAHDDTDVASADDTGGSPAVADDHSADDHDHPEPVAESASPTETTTPPSDHADHADHSDDSAASWPRPWDPAEPIDFSGADGVTAEQQARAERLVIDTLRDLPAFADVTSVAALGYRSIGDSGTGFEHYINRDLFDDDKVLDPTAPESLVYRVDGADRTLVSAMFIVARTALDDPVLTDFAGPLMQWHVHDDLCWGLDANGNRVVRGVLSGPDDTCPPGSVNTGGDSPMVHVWITPHECGPFAALEGVGAGRTAAAAGERADQCAHEH